MRLQLFDVMDETIVLLEQRRGYYKECANELQALIRETLDSSALLGVHVRIKNEKSLREKILRKQLYMQYDNKYDLLNNLSDLIGLRAECRFMREEVELYHMLCDACTMPHGDGTFSMPGHPTIRFDFSIEQPQHQRNGLAIYRIDGKYHKNGVSAPFELQIKSLVHVFWAEVEHQLIYKNNSYVLMDGFMKELLYTNYESLRQMDHNLQLIYDHMQVRSHTSENMQYSNMRPIVAKAISDIFLQHMQLQMGFALRVNNACDILAQYMLSRCELTGNPINQLIDRIRGAYTLDMTFDDALELDGAYYSEDPFHNAIGCHLSQQLNLNYDWNLFFRMLFSLEKGSSLESFSAFVEMYCTRFQSELLYTAFPEDVRMDSREVILVQLSDVLISNGDISILFEDTICRIETAIRDICTEGCQEPEMVRLCLQCAAQVQEII